MTTQQTLYCLLVLYTALLTSTCLSHKATYQKLTAPFVSRPKLALISSIISEYAVFFLLAKLFILYELSGSDFFTGSLLYIYRVDIGILLTLWALFLQAVFARQTIYESTRSMRNQASTSPKSVFSFSFWFRFSNPFWSSRSLLIHESIVYASTAEIGSYSKDMLSLDVYQHPSFPRNCPIYIHGGQWKDGSKQDRPPLLSFLALKRYVVVSINHRLAPQVSISEQLIDVKRAIRWVKENITKFGGDPSFIAVSGACSGAHLATMASMTMNNPVYQPGFEAVNTSLQACVSIAGFYDVTNDWGYNFNHKFERNIVQGKKSDVARQFSPTWLLKEAIANKARIAATEAQKLGLDLPPFLTIHGNNDCLAPQRHAREFKREFLLAVRQAKIVTIELAGCNHEFYAWSSPRSHMIAYGIEPFLRAQVEAMAESKKIN